MYRSDVHPSHLFEIWQVWPGSYGNPPASDTIYPFPRTHGLVISRKTPIASMGSCFAREIKADYASFNLYVPRYGSILREKLKSTRADKLDSSTEFCNYTNVSDQEIKKLYCYALRSFYFRPQYLMTKLFQIRTFSQLKKHFINGFSLLKKTK